MNTKTNYVILLLTFIINLFMAFSLNSFSTTELYLPMMFLYFLSGLGAFIDKISCYSDPCYKAEKIISWFGLIICLINVCLYLMYSLHFIEMSFQYNGTNYHVLLQGVPNAFFTFTSVNITPFMIISVLTIPFSYPLFGIILYLRNRQISPKKIRNIYFTHKEALPVLILFSIIFGTLGDGFCFLKSYLKQNPFGTPQYKIYFISFFILGFFIFGIYQLKHYTKEN